MSPSHFLSYHAHSPFCLATQTPLSLASSLELGLPSVDQEPQKPSIPFSPTHLLCTPSAPSPSPYAGICPHSGPSESQFVTALELFPQTPLALMIVQGCKAEKPAAALGTVAFRKTEIVVCRHLLSLAVTLWVLGGRAELLPGGTHKPSVPILCESRLLYKVLSHHQESGETIYGLF
jgi:hypothetical protein